MAAAGRSVAAFALHITESAHAIQSLCMYDALLSLTGAFGIASIHPTATLVFRQNPRWPTVQSSMKAV
jgi:hypothetical protein